MEGDNNSSMLILTALFNKNSKKSIWIEFANNLEKFIFKTFYFSHLVTIFFEIFYEFCFFIYLI
jgi:hypothetical protein